jgi:cell surface protein SprA
MDPERVTLKTFPMIPLPNWRIVYDGLSRVPLLKQVIQTANIKSRLPLNIQHIQLYYNLSYLQVMMGFSYIGIMSKGSFTPEYDISSVAISEQFNPSD